MHLCKLNPVCHIVLYILFMLTFCFVIMQIYIEMLYLQCLCLFYVKNIVNLFIDFIGISKLANCKLDHN